MKRLEKELAGVGNMDPEYLSLYTDKSQCGKNRICSTGK